MFCDFHSKHAVTTDALSTDGKSSGMGAAYACRLVAILSEQLNCVGESFLCGDIA